MTYFEDIYKVFLYRYPNADILKMPEEVRLIQLEQYLNAAQAVFQYSCKVDLTDRDEELKCYNNDLDSEIIDILVVGMQWAAKDARLSNVDNFKNFLNTKEVSLAASPANMVREMRNTEDANWKRFNSRIVLYSFMHGDDE